MLFFDIKAGAGAALARELTQQDLQAHFAAVDLTDTPALQAAIAQARATHGPIDILINNAAHDERHPTETVTPEQTYYRLHGTSGMRHVHTDAELARLSDQVRGRPDPYVMFNNLPRAGDAERFLALLRAQG